ncbi:MAG: hypothetical protein ACXQT2_04455 [Methanotrichaceae archaeon]
MDTERNLNDDLVGELGEGFRYVYTPKLEEIVNYVRMAPKADLMVIDSVGLPILAKYSEASMNEKGSMMLKAVTIAYYAKLWSYRNNGLVLMTDQPVSEFGRPEAQKDPLVLDPFGGKIVFSTKEAWRSLLVKASERETVARIVAWRSRRYGRGRSLFEVRVSDEGVDVKALF